MARPGSPRVARSIKYTRRGPRLGRALGARCKPVQCHVPAFSQARLIRCPVRWICRGASLTKFAATDPPAGHINLSVISGAKPYAARTGGTKPDRATPWKFVLTYEGLPLASPCGQPFASGALERLLLSRPREADFRRAGRIGAVQSPLEPGAAARPTAARPHSLSAMPPRGRCVFQWNLWPGLGGQIGIHPDKL